MVHDAARPWMLQRREGPLRRERHRLAHDPEFLVPPKMLAEAVLDRRGPGLDRAEPARDLHVALGAGERLGVGGAEVRLGPVHAQGGIVEARHGVSSCRWL